MNHQQKLIRGHVSSVVTLRCIDMNMSLSKALIKHDLSMTVINILKYESTGIHISKRGNTMLANIRSNNSDWSEMTSSP